MGAIARGIRFVIGLSMVGMGVTMALPLGRMVAHDWSAASVAGPGRAAVPAATPVEAPLVPPPVAAQQWMVPEEALPPAVELRSDYAPPPPPERLPPAAAAFVADNGSSMNGTYRSTLEVPPPPLLDSQSAPPAASAWAMAEPLRPVAPPSTVTADALPSIYVVRDGDDLTGIAARFYGHPAAAASVWAANQDVIPDPNLLPIGAHLRLPPPWTIQGLPASPAVGGRSIEPSVGPAAPVVPMTAVSALGGPPAMPAGWLHGQQTPRAAEPRSVAQGGVVRLGPGETLETLAVKVYGDRGAATRIWEANRDRLRSPELAVAGMELRLP